MPEVQKEENNSPDQSVKSFKVYVSLSDKDEIVSTGAFMTILFSLVAIVAEYASYLNITSGWRWLWIPAIFGLVLFLGGLFASDTSY